MQSIKKKYSLGLVGLAVLSILAVMASGQMAPKDENPYTVLTEGSNTVPTGPLGVLTYRLEKRMLEHPVRLCNGQGSMTYVLRLVIKTKEDTHGGPYSIWINDTKYRASNIGTGEYATVFNDKNLPDNATLGFSRSSDGSIAARSVLPETLDVPEEFRMTPEEFEALKPTLELVKYSTAPEIVILRIELPGAPRCLVGAYEYVIEIGGRAVLTSCAEGKFVGTFGVAALERMSGEEILVKNGNGPDAEQWRAGSLDKSTLETVDRLR